MDLLSRIWSSATDREQDPDDEFPSQDVLASVARLFRSERLLNEPSPLIAGKRLWRMSQFHGLLAGSLRDPVVPRFVALDAVNAMLDLFRLLFARHCSRLQHAAYDERKDWLGLACYMWWDNLGIGSEGRSDADRDLISDGVVPVCAATLAMSPACRESGLHGLGHLIQDKTRDAPVAARIITSYLADVPPDDPLAAYARRALQGDV